MRTIALGVIFALLLSATAFAAPTVNGATGQINNPSADVLQEGQFAAGYYHLKGGGSGVFNLTVASNLEVGVAGFRFDDTRQNATLLSAKYCILPEAILTPGLAVGVEDMAGSRQRSYYAVASKALPFGFRIHAGVGSGRFDGGFAALEKTVSPVSVLTGNNTFPATTLIAEYDGRTMNYGARVSIVPGLKADAGWRDHAAYFGLTFTK